MSQFDKYERFVSDHISGDSDEESGEQDFQFSEVYSTSMKHFLKVDYKPVTGIDNQVIYCKRLEESK